MIEEVVDAKQMVGGFRAAETVVVVVFVGFIEF